MLLNLTDALTKEGTTETFSLVYEDDILQSVPGEYKVIKNGPVELTISSAEKGRVLITGKGSLTFGAQCDRCLKEVPVTVDISIEEKISSEQIEHPADADEFPYLKGYQLDTQILIGNEILINWPGKILCKEDCKGICTKCGKDLNQGECGCDTFVPDPRMAVIQDIFNANKEV